MDDAARQEMIDAFTSLISKVDKHKGKCDNTADICPECGHALSYCNQHRAALQRRIRRAAEALEIFKNEKF